MKRRINLLSITFTKRNLTVVVRGIRIKALILLIILIIGCIAEFFTYQYLNREVEQYNKSKAVLTQYLANNNDIDKKIKYFVYKLGLLDKYLIDDANSYFYYTKLQTLLSEVAPSGKLKTFIYKNTGETTFAVAFTSYEDASSLITAIETSEFMSNFEYVKLQGFDAIPKAAAAAEFVLNIEAQFIKEDET